MTHMQDDTKKDVIEPEVLPPDNGGQRAGGASSAGAVAHVRWIRVARAVMAGLLLDLGDVVTRMPMIPHGAILGALLGWYVVRTQDVPASQRVWWIAACSVYCAMPMTEFYPLATLTLLYWSLRRPQTAG